eukprot:1532119-Rhodomonas_salina.1
MGEVAARCVRLWQAAAKDDGVRVLPECVLVLVCVCVPECVCVRARAPLVQIAEDDDGVCGRGRGWERHSGRKKGERECECVRARAHAALRPH